MISRGSGVGFRGDSFPMRKKLSNWPADAKLPCNRYSQGCVGATERGCLEL